MESVEVSVKGGRAFVSFGPWRCHALAASLSVALAFDQDLSSLVDLRQHCRLFRHDISLAAWFDHTLRRAAHRQDIVEYLLARHQYARVVLRTSLRLSRKLGLFLEFFLFAIGEFLSMLPLFCLALLFSDLGLFSLSIDLFLMLLALLELVFQIVGLGGHVF